MRTLTIGAGANSHGCGVAACETRPNDRQTLPKGAVQSVDNRRPAYIKVEKGRLWLTITGDSNDYILRPGQTLTISQRGHIVIQAMDESQFTVDEAT